MIKGIVVTSNVPPFKEYIVCLIHNSTHRFFSDAQKHENHVGIIFAWNICFILYFMPPYPSGHILQIKNHQNRKFMPILFKNCFKLKYVQLDILTFFKVDNILKKLNKKLKLF